MTQKNSTSYCLLEDINSVEEFLKDNFHSSAGRLKKFFEKSFLNKPLRSHSTLQLPLDFVNYGLINPIYLGPNIETLFEDEDFLVLNKPHNLFVHPLSYSEKDNCLTFLRNLKPELLKVNEAQYDRGLLYRLDYETSGVLIYVKKEEAYHFLRKNFQTMAKKKTYHCLVEKNCTLRGTYTHFFSSKEEKGRRVIVSDNGTEGVGNLILKPLQYIEETQVTLMEVELIQGLRHQIRAQLAHLGHPIRGDVFYGGEMASRLYLNASKYEISYHDKEYIFSYEPKNFNGL